MIRKPVVAGQFYPQTKESLLKMLSKLTSAESEKQDVKGVIIPHAGYIYSGRVAGLTLSKVDIKKTAVILGTNHSGAMPPFSIMANGSWETPLGEVKIDSEMAESVLKGSSLLKESVEPHLHEHSIEVELPFLQYLKSEVKIVPIVVSPAGIEEYRLLAKEITDGFMKTGGPAIFIASTDFTHYETREEAEKKDIAAIEAILSLDEERLFNVVKEKEISMCGSAPVCTLISICKNLGAKKVGLVKYQTSGDASGDYSSVVGYGGMVIW